MSNTTALLILALCTLVALVVAWPVLLLLRRRRRRRAAAAGADPAPAPPLRWPQVLPGLGVVVLMFLAFAQAHVAPESWLGSRLGTLEGQFWFVLFVTLAWAVLEHWGRTLLRRWRARHRPAGASRPPGEEAP